MANGPDRASAIGPPLGWKRDSWAVLGAFFALLSLIVTVWWPLAQEAWSAYDRGMPWWRQMDWLLVGDFLAMSLLIIAGADLRRDWLIAAVGLAGGLAIEGWGTQTALWTYYTGERPPLWILPAWPTAALAWDRLARLLDHRLPRGTAELSTVAYWVAFPAFIVWLVVFAAPFLGEPLTLLAIMACVLLTLLPTDRRAALLVFAAGAGLGYFLELWGTTRECWTYYTRQTPPAFAVAAHGMAAVAFWRCTLLARDLWDRFRTAIRSARTSA